MSQPVVNELVIPHMDAADDAVTDSDVLRVVQSQPVVSSSVKAEKWEKYKHKTNKARREKYIINSLHEKGCSYKTYHKNRSHSTQERSIQGQVQSRLW